VKPSTVLFADDDRDFQQVIGLILEDAGFQVLFADNAYQAIEIWQTSAIDVIILDFKMPGMNGVQLCAMIRQKSEIPILMVTGNSNEEDVVRALEAGADDYVVKPIRPRELVARLQALLRRGSVREVPDRRQLAFDHLILDLESRQLIYNEKSIPVSPLEFQLLKYLMMNAGVVLSKEDLLRNVWGYFSTGREMNMIEATVRRLRKKVETDPSSPQYIQTVWGSGYRFGD
jgi:two-component system response regulator MtrA